MIGFLTTFQHQVSGKCSIKHVWCSLRSHWCLLWVWAAHLGLRCSTSHCYGGWSYCHFSQWWALSHYFTVPVFAQVESILYVLELLPLCFVVPQREACGLTSQAGAKLLQAIWVLRNDLFSGLSYALLVRTKDFFFKDCFPSAHHAAVGSVVNLQSLSLSSTR